MVYSLLLGFFGRLKESFWGYHGRITEKIDHYTLDSDIYGQDDMLVRTLEKQQKELEDIMSQYVFYRFCERISVFFTQVDMVLLFCATLVTVIFAHSAVLEKEYIWLVVWLAVYAGYTWYELSGAFIKFEIWATNLFLKQYKVLSRTGSARNIVEAKKENKKTVKKLYLFFILPGALVSLGLLLKFVIIPFFPEISVRLQADILARWGIYAAGGLAFVIGIFIFLDRAMNLRLRLSLNQFRESIIAATIYLFLSFVLAVIVSVAKFIV